MCQATATFPLPGPARHSLCTLLATRFPVCKGELGAARVSQGPAAPRPPVFYHQLLRISQDCAIWGETVPGKRRKLRAARASLARKCVLASAIQVARPREAEPQRRHRGVTALWLAWGWGLVSAQLAGQPPVISLLDNVRCHTAACSGPPRRRWLTGRLPRALPLALAQHLEGQLHSGPGRKNSPVSFRYSRCSDPTLAPSEKKSVRRTWCRLSSFNLKFKWRRVPPDCSRPGCRRGGWGGTSKETGGVGTPGGGCVWAAWLPPGERLCRPVQS